MRVLTDLQMKRYADEGYVRVGGLIPQQIVREAAEALSTLHANDPDVKPNVTGAYHKSYDDPKLRALYGDRLLAAVAEITARPIETITPPSCPYTIVNVPSGGMDFDFYPHVDWMTKTNAPAFRSAVMVYLSDVDPGGGATFVSPGSHRVIKAVADAISNEAFDLMALQTRIRGGDLPIGPLVEAITKAGDVIFMDAYMVHAGGVNRSARLRLALNWKW